MRESYNEENKYVKIKMLTKKKYTHISQIQYNVIIVNLERFKFVVINKDINFNPHERPLQDRKIFKKISSVTFPVTEFHPV
jgi:hypothetical protein